MLGNFVLSLDVHFSQVMRHSYQGELCFYLSDASYMETSEAHVVFYISKTTFNFYASLFS
jgi:hypothetical protein